MPRYFISTNASRNYSAGGITFAFEPVSLRGGSWLGVLALEEDSDANILLSAGFPQVAEINQERYENEKKKQTGQRTSSPTQPGNPKPVGPGVAEAVGRSSGHGAGDVADLSRNPNSTSGIGAISLLSAPVTPPHEPLLEQPSTRRARPVRKR